MSTASPSTRGDQATVTVTVEVDPAEAFAVFTENINLWWRRGPRFRNSVDDRGMICIERGVGGRIFESLISADGERVVEIGRTRIWDPPHRLLFEWRNSNFSPAEHTEVEVLFEPSASGTRVTVAHRGWSKLRSDHPARHGLDTQEFIRMIGLWWRDQMRSLVEQAKLRSPT